MVASLFAENRQPLFRAMLQPIDTPDQAASPAFSFSFLA